MLPISWSRFVVVAAVLSGTLACGSNSQNSGAGGTGMGGFAGQGGTPTAGGDANLVGSAGANGVTGPSVGSLELYGTFHAIRTVTHLPTSSIVSRGTLSTPADSN